MVVRQNRRSTSRLQTVQTARRTVTRRRQLARDGVSFHQSLYKPQSALNTISAREKKLINYGGFLCVAAAHTTQLPLNSLTMHTDGVIYTADSKSAVWPDCVLDGALLVQNSECLGRRPHRIFIYLFCQNAAQMHTTVTRFNSAHIGTEPSEKHLFPKTSRQSASTSTNFMAYFQILV